MMGMALGTSTALAITKTITSIETYQNGFQTGMVFTFEDDTTAETVSVDPHDPGDDKVMCLPGRFIGLSCSFTIHPITLETKSLNGCGVYYDARVNYIFSPIINDFSYTVTPPKPVYTTN